MRSVFLIAALLCGLPAFAQLGGVLTAGLITQARGKVAGQTAQGKPVPVKQGQPVRPGMIIASEPGSDTVLAFPDGQIGVLGSGGQFRLNNYLYDLADPSKNDINLNLIEGNLRVVMGEIGQSNPSALKLQVGTASVGLQPSGQSGPADASLISLDGAVAVTVQEGLLEVRLPSGAVLRVGPGQTLYMRQDGTSQVDTTAKMSQELSQSALGLQILGQMMESRSFSQVIAQTQAMMAPVTDALKNRTATANATAQEILAQLESLSPAGLGNLTAQAASELQPPGLNTASTPATGAGAGGTPCGASCN